MTVELTSLADLAGVLMHDTNEVLLRVHEALGASAEYLEKTAKDEFGEYQLGIGPFTAWPELADSTKADRVAKGYTENDPLLRTGELRDSIQHEVVGFDAFVGSTSDIMPFQEFGTSRIPPRPVLGTALQKCWPMIQRVMGEAVATGISGGYAQTPLKEAAARLDTNGPSPLGYNP